MNEKGFYFLETGKRTESGELENSQLGGLKIYEIEEKLQIIILGRPQLEKLLGKELVEILCLFKEEDGLVEMIKRYTPFESKKELKYETFDYLLNEETHKRKIKELENENENLKKKKEETKKD